MILDHNVLVGENKILDMSAPTPGAFGALAGPRAAPFPLFALPYKIRQMILEYCIASPEVETDDKYEVAGPTVAQKGAALLLGRDWDPKHLAPYYAVRAVCHTLRKDADVLFGRANVLKIKYPRLAIVWLEDMGRACIASLCSLSLTIVSVTERRKEKYAGLADAAAGMSRHWIAFLNMLVGMPLAKLHINFAEWTPGPKVAFDVSFWKELDRLTVTERLTLEGSYLGFGLSFLKGLKRRSPQLEFVDLGDQYDWTDPTLLILPTFTL